MRRKFARLPAVLGTAFTGAVLALNAARPAEPAKLPDPNPAANIQLVQQPAVPSVPPVQPTQPTPTPATTPPSAADTSTTPSAAGAGAASSLAGSLLGTAGSSVGGTTGGAVNPSSTSGGALSASQQAASATGSNVVGGGEATSRATSDLGDLLGKSINALGVEVWNRSPIVTEPFIRGYHPGQYITSVDGGLWMPARSDLDTVVSKIDSSQIENVVIIKGPYSVRYGPGFAFLDVETLSTPRYETGWQVHDGAGLTYKSNGQQWFGLESVWGGNEKMGFRMTYTIEDGSDYWDAQGVRMPSRFNSQSFNFDIGYDLGRYSHLELKAMHLFEDDIQIPGALYSINYLSTDAYTVRYIFDDREYSRFVLNGWFNNTELYGDNSQQSVRLSQPVVNSIQPEVSPGQQYFATVDARMASWGTRGAFTLGAPKSLQFTVGADLQYLDGSTNSSNVTSPLMAGVNGFAFNGYVPSAYMQDPGVFADVALPLLDNRLQLKSGIRFDWARTAINNLSAPLVPGIPPAGQFTPAPTSPGAYGPPPQNILFPGAFTGDELRRDFTLMSVFATAEYKATDHLTLLAGAGQAQRPPTFSELYAISPFVGVIQNGANLLNGNPELAPETLRQVDLGFKVNYDKFRGGASAFYSWIHNYITYENTGVFKLASDFIRTSGPPSFNTGFVNQFVNTDEAILAGGEAYAEADARDWLTVFSTLSYVQGTDETVNGRPFQQVPAVTPGFNFTGPAPGPSKEPLPMIPPLDVRLGLRIHDPGNQPKWALEFSSRTMSTQDQVAVSLHELPTPGYTLFDLRGYWKQSDHLLLTAGIENLTNVFYRESFDLRFPMAYGVFQPGRSFYVGARYTY